jgi:hypothetical protein
VIICYYSRRVKLTHTIFGEIKYNIRCRSAQFLILWYEEGWGRGERVERWEEVYPFFFLFKIIGSTMLKQENLILVLGNLIIGVISCITDM